MTVFDWLHAVRDAPEITGVRLAVLYTVALFMDGCAGFVSIEQIMDRTGLSDGCVRGHLRWARSNGWLQQARRGHRLGNGVKLASEYVLTMPQPAPPCRLTSSGTTMPVEGSLPASEGSLPASEGGLYRHPGAAPVLLPPVPLPPVASNPTDALLIAAGATDEEAAGLRAALEKDPDVQSPSGLVRYWHRSGELPQKLADYRARIAVTVRPPWCGACDEENRQIDVGKSRARCPRCHPLTRPGEAA